MARPKGGLGKGLDALFVDNGTDDIAVSSLSIEEIEPNADQPRKDFTDEALTQLADSIKEHGIIQPLIVRPKANGRYQIVAGERRWRAARIAGLKELPVVVKELSDRETHEMALVENLIREDLNPVEEALGYKTLAETYSLTQEDIAKAVGKSRPAVANALRLLDLPSDVISLLEKGSISAGHARALLPLDEKAAVATAKEILSSGMSVRDVEKKVRALLKTPKAPPKKVPVPTMYTEMELALKEALSRKVKVVPKGNGKGEITIEFYSDEELKTLGDKLTK